MSTNSEKQRTSRPLRRLAGGLLAFLESIVWGGDLRERLLLRILAGHYRSRVRRDWIFRQEAPHFFPKRITWFFVSHGPQWTGPFPLLPGVHSAELLRPLDRVLDIGCGDGFYVGRFYAGRCAAIDAIDIEPSSIAHATAWYGAPNVRFLVRDAFTEPFPFDAYDAILWDGGLGHVSREQSRGILQKIAGCLGPDGVFSGSESLGDEGHDHLQYFPSLSDLAAVLRPHFQYVELMEQQYQTLTPGLVRREGYWRCANEPARIRERHWKIFGDKVDSRDEH